MLALLNESGETDEEDDMDEHVDKDDDEEDVNDDEDDVDREVNCNKGDICLLLLFSFLLLFFA
jgi:hypothetical protein